MKTYPRTDLGVSGNVQSPICSACTKELTFRPLRARTHQLQFSRNGENQKTNFSWSLKIGQVADCGDDARDVKNSFPNTIDKLMLHRENRFSV